MCSRLCVIWSVTSDLRFYQSCAAECIASGLFQIFVTLVRLYAAGLTQAMLTQRNLALPLCNMICLLTGMDGSIICAPQQSGCRAVRTVTQHCVQDSSSLRLSPYLG